MTEVVASPTHAAGLDELTVVPTGTRAGQGRVRHALFWTAVIWLGLVAAAAALADVLPLTDPNIDAGAGVYTGPFQNWSEILGTDQLGRSMLSRVVYGARVSLVAGLASVAIAFAIGLVIGVTAGFFRGKTDSAIGIVIDAVLAFPGIILLLAISSALQPSLQTIVVGLSILAIPAFARVSRANTLAVASSEFLLAAEGLGCKTRTIVVRELVPIVARSMFALAGTVVATLILAEAGLSFLGLGVPPPQPSWGNIIADGRTSLQQHPHVVFVPAVVLFLTIYALNLVADRFRAGSR